MKRDFTSDFNEIKEMTNKIRSYSTLNESINFSDEYAEGEAPVDEPVEGEVEVGLDGKEPVDSKEAEQQEIVKQSEDPDSYISKIRELTLKGLLALSTEPTSPKYNILRQVFQYIDKANKEKEKEEAGE